MSLETLYTINYFLFIVVIILFAGVLILFRKVFLLGDRTRDTTILLNSLTGQMHTHTQVLSGIVNPDQLKR